MNMSMTRSGIAATLDSWKSSDRGYADMTGASQQAVDLWMHDRISSNDLTREAAAFLYAKGFRENLES